MTPTWTALIIAVLHNRAEDRMVFTKRRLIEIRHVARPDQNIRVLAPSLSQNVKQLFHHQIWRHGAKIILGLDLADGFGRVKPDLFRELKRIDRNQRREGMIRAAVLRAVAESEHDVQNGDSTREHIRNGQRWQDASAFFEPERFSADVRASSRRVGDLLEAWSLGVVAVWSVAVEVEVDRSLVALLRHLDNILEAESFALKRSQAESLHDYVCAFDQFVEVSFVGVFGQVERVGSFAGAQGESQNLSERQ